MTETKTNRQRRLAKNERDEKAWSNIRGKSYDERRDMAAEVLAEFRRVELAQVDSRNGDRSVGRLFQLHEKAKQRALPRSDLPEQGHPLTGLDRKVDTIEHGSAVRIVAEAKVLDSDLGLEVFDREILRASVVAFHLHRHDLVQALQGTSGLLQSREQRSHHRHGPHRTTGEDHAGDHRSHRHLLVRDRIEGRDDDRLAMTMELNRLDRKDEREARRDERAYQNRKLDLQEARLDRKDRQAAIQQMMAGLAQLGASIAI